MARSAYYKWASGKLSHRATENGQLADKIEKIHLESPDKGYRRLADDLRHGRRFTSKQELVQMIEQYIRYYNTKRVQRNLGVLTPMEKYELYCAA